jgi:hypothetical protein
MQSAGTRRPISRLGFYLDQLEAEGQRRFGIFELLAFVQFLRCYFSSFFCRHVALLDSIEWYRSEPGGWVSGSPQRIEQAQGQGPVWSFGRFPGRAGARRVEIFTAVLKFAAGGHPRWPLPRQNEEAKRRGPRLARSARQLL